MAADSRQWRCVEAVPAFAFSVEGLSAVRAREPRRQGWLTVAEGEVEDVGPHHMTLSNDATVAFALSPCVSLANLRGRRVKLTLHDEPGVGGPRCQTLAVATGGAVRLVARFGPAGRTHAVGRVTRVRAALSQRPAGPMMFGTDELQCVVQVGQHVRFHGEGREFVVHFAERTAIDYVAYLIAERSLWVSEIP